MIRLVEGFDALATADLARMFNTVGGFTDVVTTTIRNGTRALESQAGSLGSIKYTNQGGNQATGVVGFGLRLNSLSQGKIFSFLDSGSEQVTIWSVGDGRLRLLKGDFFAGAPTLGTSTNSLVTNTWYYVECKVLFSHTVGTVELRVNGSATNWIPSITGIDTTATANEFFSQFAWGAPAGMVWFDDIYCADGVSPATDFLGDRRVVTVVASSGDGTYGEFTPLSGTDNGAMVDETTPDGDTTYNASSTLNHRDTYNFAALGVTGLIAAVELVNWGKKSDAGSRAVTGMTRIGSTDYLGTNAVALADANYLPVREIWENSPATSVPWTVSEIDGAEFGVKVTT